MCAKAVTHSPRLPPSQHSSLFSQEELRVLHANLESGTASLENARRLPLPARIPLKISTREKRPGRGRPKVIIDPAILSDLLPFRGPQALAKTAECHRRTIRRRALEAGISQPGAPVFSSEVDEFGEELIYHSSTSAPVSTLSDAELDEVNRSIQLQFRELGAGQLQGGLLNRGHKVPKDRITASLLRIEGVPGVFGNRRPKVRKYRTRAPMTTVHHDGQHGKHVSFVRPINLCTKMPSFIGLIQYKIVIHCFIDGFSRYILGIRAHNNNRAQTVLDFFLTEVVEKHGVPERVRGDHGVENLRVAEWMRNERGVENKPYQWGA